MSGAAYGIAALYVAVSPLLHRVLAEAGLFAPLIVTAGGGLCLLLAALWKRWGSHPLFAALYGVALLAYLLTTTARVADAYLFHGASYFALALLMALFAAVGLVASASALRYACRMFLTVSVLLYALVMLIGARQGSWDALWPLPSLSGASVAALTLWAALAFLPLLAPLLAEGNAPRLLLFGCAVGVVVLAAALGLVAFPPHMLTEHNDLFLEVAKNMSLGRFFQRMAFPGMLLFLILSLLMILHATTGLAGLARANLAQKGKRRLIAVCLYLAGVLPALLAAPEDKTREAALVLAGAAALLAVIWRGMSNPLRRRMAALLLALACLPLSSCLAYHEIDTFEYPLIIGVEWAGEGMRYLFRSESASVSVCADSLTAARETVNRQRAKPIDLSQLGMVIVPTTAEDILRGLVAEVESGNVDNAVLVCVTDDSVEALRTADFSGYHSISEFFDEFKSHQEPYDFVDRTAFEADAAHRSTQTMLVARVRFDSGPLLADGAVAYGQGRRWPLTNPQLEQVFTLRQSGCDAYVADGQFRILLPQTVSEPDWIASLYDATGRDVLGVYAKLARRAGSADAYEALRRSVEETTIIVSKN